MSRKIHPSAVIKNLPDEDQAALFAFLESKTLVEGKPRGKTLADGVAWLFSNNGIRTSDSSLSDWRGWYEMNLEIGSWENDANEFKAMLVKSGTDDDLAAKIAEARFLSQAAKKNDAETFVKVMSVIERYKTRKASEQSHADRMQLEDKKLKRKDRSLDQAEKKLAQAERRIAALEAQAEAAAKAAEKTRDALKSGGMDDTTRQQLIAEMDHLILGKPKPRSGDESSPIESRRVVGAP